MNILLYARIGGVLLLALPIILKEVSKILAEIPGEQPGEVLIKEKIQPVLDGVAGKIAGILLK